jgi:hypothetical protein
MTLIVLVGQSETKQTNKIDYMLFYYTCMFVCIYRFMKMTLDQYVEMDYVIVYFHHGMTSKNKPKLSWMVQVYRELDRK